MALLDSEIQRIKRELGYNVLTVGAEPYIGIFAVFDQVVQAYMSAGASTTSTTTVAVASTSTPVTLTLADATGFAAFATVVIDVDDRQEIATVQSISGSTITLLLAKAHTGTYPVTVEGGESMVRQILAQLRDVNTRLLTVAATAGLKRAEEVEWYQGLNGGSAQVQSLTQQRDIYRDELAATLGVVNMWTARKTAALGTVLY